MVQRFTRSSILALFTAGALMASAVAQENKIPVWGHLPTTAKAGKTVNATVAFKVPAGFHIYAPGFTGTGVGVSFQLEKVKGFTLGKPKAKGSGELTGKVVMTVPIVVAKHVHGAQSLALTVTYQECNDRICYPPATETLHLKTNVK